MTSGSSGGRTASPNGSRPRLPTVHSPKVNLSAGVGVSAAMGMRIMRGSDSIRPPKVAIPFTFHDDGRPERGKRAETRGYRMEIVDSGLESGYTSTSMTRHRAAWQGLVIVLVAISAAACNREAPAPVARDWRATGRSDPAFQAPSLAAGVDYTVPAEAEIKQALDRVRDHFVRSTPYRIVDTATGQPVTDLATPTKTVGIDLRPGEFNDWTYSMGVVLAGMLLATDVTGDAAFQAVHAQELRLHLRPPRLLPRSRRRSSVRSRTATAACSTCASSTTAARSARRSSRPSAKKADPRYRAGHRPRRRLHLAQDDAAARRHAGAPAAAVADRLVRRRLHEHSVPGADGRPDRRPRSTSTTRRTR